jgi:molybdopterin synthase catalytic subunit
VLYFAGARDAAGTPREVLSFSTPVTAGGLLDAVVAAHPALGEIKASLRVSVNRDAVSSGKLVKDGDEVGVLPPVAGG